ncbi:MAG: hypothetical protein J1F25_02730 [Prevotellaceae bacterium]|nr:hypothetical protein [Prevotellaceae bacterium]
MELRIERISVQTDYTIGRLLVDGVYFCDTMEPTDRGLVGTMTAAEVRAVKRKGLTAIPVGRYRVTLAVKSPKMSAKVTYRFCDGRLPRLVNVPGYEGILIHIGNFPRDTQGCILVGRNVERGKLLYSTQMFRRLYEVLQAAVGRGEDVWAEVRR